MTKKLSGSAGPNCFDFFREEKPSFFTLLFVDRFPDQETFEGEIAKVQTRSTTW